MLSFPAQELDESIPDDLMSSAVQNYPQFAAIRIAMQDDGYGNMREAPYETSSYVGYYMFLVEH